MSTRCQIRVIVNGCNTNIYHHCDGYFSHLGRELKRWLIEAFEKEPQQPAFYLEEKMSEDPEYEITFFPHCDIEYFYLLDFDKSVFKGYHLPFDCKCWKDEKIPWYEKIPAFDTEKNLLTDDF